MNPPNGENDTLSTTIDILTDNVLLDIFDFYRNTHDDADRAIWKWHLLVHVCRRWRQIIFESPHRLNLKIRCTSKTPVRENLGIWPAFLIAIDFRCAQSADLMPGDEDNVIAALDHPDRVCYIKLDLPSFRLEPLVTAIQEPLPVLTHLIVLSGLGNAPTFLPAGFLGGSASRLQMIHLRSIVFPALPTLLFSASDLVELQLRKIPPTGYISPVAIAVCLATLPRLKTLAIRFQSPTFRSDEINPPPVTRSVLPALTNFEFTGSSKYLEDFVAYIDCPRLNKIEISYLADFRVTQLSRFFDRSLGPEISPFMHAKVYLDAHGVTFNLYRPSNRTGWDGHPATTVISCRRINWKVSRMAQVLRKLSVMLSTVVDLKIVGKFKYWEIHPLSDADDLEWLRFLHQLSAVQSLYVSLPPAERVARALKYVKGEVVSEALPSLDLIGLESVESLASIDKFVAARNLSGRRLTVVDSEAEFDKRLQSHGAK